MRQSERKVKRIEKSERRQEKIVEKKKAHMEKVSQKGDSERTRMAEVDLNNAISLLEQIKADKTRAEVQDQIFAFVEHNQPVEITEIAKALNLPAVSIEGHIKVLKVAKDEDGKLYRAEVKPSGMKLEAKLASLKSEISEIGHGIKSKMQKDKGEGVVIERWKEIVTVNPNLARNELKEIYIMLYPEEEEDIGRYLEKIKDDARVEEGVKADVGAKTEDTRWIEPAMSFLIALSSFICYLYSRSFFMELPPPRASMDWYYGLARLDLYKGVFLWLIILAILGGLFLIGYRKIGVPILILGGVFQFLLSPLYLISSQPPTPSFQIVALMPTILAACLVMVGLIAWIRRPLPKERVEGLKKRLKRSKMEPGSLEEPTSLGEPRAQEKVMAQRETFKIQEDTNEQENVFPDQKNEAVMKAAISEYLADSDPEIVGYVRLICYDALWIESFMERSKKIDIEKYPDFISTYRSEYHDWLNVLETSKEPGLSRSKLSSYAERIKLCDVLLDSLDLEQRDDYPEVVEEKLIAEQNKVIERIYNVLKPFFDAVSVELEGNNTKEDIIRVFMNAYLEVLGDSESAPIWIT
jgi:hypothetical protein